jgi:PadR family transcriptional regulator PadR
MIFTVSGILLDACVLGALSSAPAYGYELTQKTQSVLGVSESALYPVLRRLLKDDMLSSFDEPYDGRNRRYYQLTDKGTEKLSEYITEWDVFKTNIDGMIAPRQQIEADEPAEGKKWYE